MKLKMLSFLSLLHGRCLHRPSLHILLIAGLLFLFVSPAFSQTVYHFTSRLPGVTDTAQQHLFFIRFENGTGIVRIKLGPTEKDSVRLVEMQAREEYPPMAAGGNSPDKLYFNLKNPVTKAGSGTGSLSPFVIVFKKGSGEEYEPAGLAGSTKDLAVIPFITNETIDPSKLDKELVLQYFSKTDVVYKNLFGTRPRGIDELTKKTKIILLVVANVNDGSIGASCEKDKNRMVETFQDLANFLEIGFQSTLISGDNYNKKSVQTAIDTLKPNANDIVVFYYSGHGFRKAKDNSNPYPYIDMRPKPDNTYMVNSLSLMNDIFVKIKSKGARFNLILGDCCNTDPEKMNSTGPPPPAKRGFPGKWSPQNCSNLFLNPKPMSIIASAARPDEEASSNNDFGGFFSYFFKSSMEGYFSMFKPNVSWDIILQEATTQTSLKAQRTYCSKPYIPANICQQTPLYKVY